MDIRSDSDYVKVSVPHDGVITMLLGFWYKNSGILDGIGTLAADVPMSDFFDSYDDVAIGEKIVKHHRLEKLFADFISSFEYGVFAKNVIRYNYDESTTYNYGPHRYAYDRMVLDIGRAAKSTDWWKSNKKQIASQQRKNRIIKSVMDV